MHGYTPLSLSWTLPLLLFKLRQRISSHQVSCCFDATVDLLFLALFSDQNVKIELEPTAYHDEHLDEFRDFVNFIDGVGLSAQWTPEYDFDWMRLGDQHQESRRHSPVPDRGQFPATEDIGTPFSTWLPSAPADDHVRLVSDVGYGEFKFPL
jgi:hypothetical protein